MLFIFILKIYKNFWIETNFIRNNIVKKFDNSDNKNYKANKKFDKKQKNFKLSDLAWTFRLDDFTLQTKLIFTNLGQLFIQALIF